MLNKLSVMAPYEVTQDTYLIPTFLDKWPPSILPIHTMVIRGVEPVLIDTGCVGAREEWLKSVFSVVEPNDLRWVILSHADHDHIGNASAILELCPNAKLVSSLSIATRLLGSVSFPLDRSVWIGDTEAMQLPDRTLQFVNPPLYDSPTTRGIFDTKSGVLWGADAFFVGLPGETLEAGDVPPDFFEATFAMLNQGHTPWLPLVDPTRFETLLKQTASLPVTTWLSAHAPVLRGNQITDVFERTRKLAGAPSQVPELPPNLLDVLLQSMAG